MEIMVDAFQTELCLCGAVNGEIGRLFRPSFFFLGFD